MFSFIALTHREISVLVAFAVDIKLGRTMSSGGSAITARG